MEFYWFATILSFILFGLMTFAGIAKKDSLYRLKTPLAFQVLFDSNVFNILITFGYFVGLFLIFISGFTGAGVGRAIITILLLQFLINHLVWGSLVGFITGLWHRKDMAEIFGNKKK